ncbi:MAG: hypothetical protein D6797_07460 [Bdellovibrio sp.]|nr:MAG: hypothetical protein D6797_07460 [Bdellovibrio sp.]
MAKPMFVSLDALIVNENEETPKLIKRVDESYLSRTFGDLVNYILDPNPDALNPDGYNINEKEMAKKISDWFSEASTDDQVDVTLWAIKKDEQPIGPLSLTQTVSDRSDEIITIKTETLDGAEVKFKHLDFLVQRDNNSGLGISAYMQLEKEGSLYVMKPHIMISLY